MEKIGISARGIGKVNEKGEVTDYKVVSYDFVSLYPNMMKDHSEEIKRWLLRKERKEKLDKINKINDEN